MKQPCICGLYNPIDCYQVDCDHPSMRALVKKAPPAPEPESEPDPLPSNVPEGTRDLDMDE